jgi:NTP pyrophosphatase (non-canonical NTP hydrolase)
MTLKITNTDTNGFTVSIEDYIRIVDRVEDLIYYCNGLAKANNWWDKERNIPEVLCLIHSEISEAMEGFRKDKMDEHLPDHKSITVELADAIVRICDLAGALKLPLGKALAEKLCYNQSREDHKLENRMAPGGKKF